MNRTTRSAGAEPSGERLLPTGFDLERLPRLPVAELRRLWTEHLGSRTPPPQQRRVLIRELAWRVQERHFGGLDPETADLLKAAIRRAAAALRARTPEAGDMVPGPDAPPTRPGRTRGPSIARGLSTSSRLLRKWGGRTHEVEVLDGGRKFRYRGEEFRSLSEIARQITGSHWSGPRFFGLTNRRKPGEEPDA